MQFQGFKPLGLSLEGTPAKIQAVAKFSLCETSAHKKGPRNLRPFYFWGIGELAKNQLANLNTSPSKFFQIIERKNFR